MSKLTGSRPSVQSRRGVRRLIRLINGTSLGLAFGAGVATVALMVHVLADITARTVFNRPIGGVLEATQHWWMISIVFLGLAYALQRREHIVATVVLDALPAGWRRVADAVAIVLLFVLAVAFANYGWREAIHSFEIQEATVVDPVISIWPFVFLVPLGCAALAIQCIGSLLEIALGVEPETPPDELI